MFKPGDMVPVPWLVALALQADGWVLRADLPWVKRSAMPESVTNRPAKALEYVFMLTKGPGAFFDIEAVRRPPSGVPGGAAFGKIAEGEEECRANGQGARRYDRPEPEQAAGRAFRNADLWFASVEPPWGMVGAGDEMVGLDVTSGGGYDGAHFATFPTKLIEPLIKAATSERGCCSHCGAPWRRIVDKTIIDKRVKENGVRANAVGELGQGGSPNSLREGVATRLNGTLGWQPGCGCRAEVVPCVVCDPFLGSGTTALVALALGRRAVGIDLSAAYIDDHSVPRLKAFLANRAEPVRPKKPASKGGVARKQVGLVGDEA